MNDIKMPKINFIPLKQCITDDELNEYMVNSDDTNFLIYLRCKYKTDKEWEYLVEAATCGFDDGIIWLNDWDEGQQDVEYLAITKLGERKWLILKTDLGFGQAYAFSCVISLTRDDNVLAYVLALGLHLGYSIEEIYNEYIRKNEINKERLKEGY